MTTARQLIQAQIDAGATHRAIAAKVGVSNAAITTYVNGKYPAGVTRLEKKIVEAYERVDCPFLTREIATADCHRYAAASCPTSSPLALRHWRACQSCALNPNLANKATP